MIRPKTPLERSHADMVHLLQRLTHPEDLGWAVSEEVIKLASAAAKKGASVQAEHEAQLP